MSFKPLRFAREARRRCGGRARHWPLPRAPCASASIRRGKGGEPNQAAVDFLASTARTVVAPMTMGPPSGGPRCSAWLPSPPAPRKCCRARRECCSVLTRAARRGVGGRDQPGASPPPAGQLAPGVASAARPHDGCSRHPVETRRVVRARRASELRSQLDMDTSHTRSVVRRNVHAQRALPPGRSDATCMRNVLCWPSDCHRRRTAPFMVLLATTRVELM